MKHTVGLPDMRVKHCLWPQHSNTAKPMRSYNTFPQVQSNTCKTCSCGSGCSFYRTLSRWLYKIKLYCFRWNLKM
jgi:hypothetical protein